MATKAYFQDTDPIKWDISEVVSLKLRENHDSNSEVFDAIIRLEMENYEFYFEVFDAIRLDLENYDHDIAKKWKENWSMMEFDYMVKKTSDSGVTIYASDRIETMKPYFIFDGQNISELCHKFREKYLQQVDNFDQERKMAINRVYLINRDNTNSFATRHLSSFFTSYQFNNFFSKLTDNEAKNIYDVAWCFSLGEYENGKKLAVDYLQEDCNNLVAEIMYNLVNHYPHDDSYLVPFTDPVFRVGGVLKKEGIYSNLHGSNSMKADMRYSANIKDAVEYDFLIFESRGLFKMSLKLQFMINRFILNKINNSVVYGVVGPDHDRQYDIYQMDLVSPKTYLMIKIRSFFVPRMVCDFNVAGNTIPALVQLKTLVTVQVDVARQNCDSQEKLRWIEYPDITPYET